MISLEIILITVNTILTLKHLHCSVTLDLFFKKQEILLLETKVTHLRLNVIHKILYFLIILLVISSAAPMTFAGTGGSGDSNGINLDYVESED